MVEYAYEPKFFSTESLEPRFREFINYMIKDYPFCIAREFFISSEKEGSLGYEEQKQRANLMAEFGRERKKESKESERRNYGKRKQAELQDCPGRGFESPKIGGGTRR